jgi:hypothetical protein
MTRMPDNYHIWVLVDGWRSLRIQVVPLIHTQAASIKYPMLAAMLMPPCWVCALTIVAIGPQAIPLILFLMYLDGLLYMFLQSNQSLVLLGSLER